jgi:hypothetical protein
MIFTQYQYDIRNQYQNLSRKVYFASVFCIIGFSSKF